MKPPTMASSLQDKVIPAEPSTNKPKVVQFLSGIELQAAKRFKRSGAKAILGFMNNSYEYVNGRH